ncbi:MAG: tetratricopeptide repeat protein [Pseudomonadota bacterium]
MTKLRLAHIGLVMAALGFTAAAPVLGLSPAAYAAETVRPEVGTPLQAAQQLMKSGKNKEALSKLRELDSVGGKTPNEVYLIERVRAAAAAASGDNDAAIKAFEALLASGKLPAAEASKFNEGLIGMYMRAKDYNKANGAIQRAMKESNDPKLRAYLIQNLYNQGNTAQVQAEVRNMEKAGQTPSEDLYGMLANMQNKANDKNGYVNTIEKLAANYPKERYWVDLLNRVSGKTGFSGRLTVDVYRLKLANGLIKKPGEYMEMGQLVLQAKAPAEAVKLVDKAYKAGALGTGADAPRHQRLKDLADKEAAELVKNAGTIEAALTKDKDNDGLINLGYALVQAGQTDKGLKLMESAMKAGSLKNAEEAKLHLGEAYAAAGKKSQAIQMLKTVGGSDGSADLARYWIMAINHPAA